MIKILFVCTGNICRSPMAEAVLKDKAQERGIEVKVDSAGTISYHVGQKADIRTLEELNKHGIWHEGEARQVREKDFFEFDYILGMAQEHVEALKEMRPKGASAVIQSFLDFSEKYDGDVPDPYYINGFDKIFLMVEDGVEGILEMIK